MGNKIRFITKQGPDNKYFLEIRKPLLQDGPTTTDFGPVLIKQAFNSQEEAYQYGQNLLLSQDSNKDSLDNDIEYL